MALVMVCAGSYPEAREWAHAEGLRPNEWRYVLDERVLRGRSGFMLVTLPGFDGHQHAAQIRCALGFIEAMGGFQHYPVRG